MTRAMELRAELNAALAGTGEKLSVNDLIVRACAQALDRSTRRPTAPTSTAGTSTTPTSTSGIAVALDDGLIVPVAARRGHEGRAPDRRPRRATWPRARATGRLQASARSRAARSPCRTWACSTSPAFAAIINPPESAILAVGATSPRPVVVDGQIAAEASRRLAGWGSGSRAWRTSITCCGARPRTPTSGSATSWQAASACGSRPIAAMCGPRPGGGARRSRTPGGNSGTSSSRRRASGQAPVTWPLATPGTTRRRRCC